MGKKKKMGCDFRKQFAHFRMWSAWLKSPSIYMPVWKGEPCLKIILRSTHTRVLMLWSLACRGANGESTTTTDDHGGSYYYNNSSSDGAKREERSAEEQEDIMSNKWILVTAAAAGSSQRSTLTSSFSFRPWTGYICKWFDGTRVWKRRNRRTFLEKKSRFVSRLFAFLILPTGGISFSVVVLALCICLCLCSSLIYVCIFCFFFFPSPRLPFSISSNSSRSQDPILTELLLLLLQPATFLHVYGTKYRQL